ncbi:bifunctional riboflavin kinase/FAD synthetase [Robiginitalea myxolifaciens]|uniref:bifunctional riboflavin kinase/FAD synthetase n=1 Tax=Robiginitalea myxolifaciens TaxID=400055 RepID=UPI000B8824ED|nr:bifunctional riboflavin kinase/FAD synthetase [Robiginitalea myxolifaciens]
MKTIKGLSDFQAKRPSVVTIGTFDGVHVGHRKILDRLILSGKDANLESTLLTFYPHPRMVLQKDTDLRLLSSIEEKTQILNELGLDALIIHPFTKEFSRLTAKEFVRQILVNRLQARRIIIGYDHRFGRNRSADIQDLRAYGNLYGFEVEEINAQEIDDISVSSTKIRKALNEGDLETANRYLGYAYTISGKVIRGKGLGRELGFPTANLQPDTPYKLIPRQGVYVVSATHEQTTRYGMMNIGMNPTVDGTREHIEIHFFELDQDLYDQPLQVRLHKRLRDEIKFSSLDSLKAQLTADQEQARNYIATLE